MIEPHENINGRGEAGPAPATDARRRLPLTVGARVYTLIESMNAYCRMETITNTRTSAIVLEASLGDMRATRALLWAHLQTCHGDEIATVEAAGDLVDAVGLELVWAQLKTLAGLESDARPPARRRTGAR